jgi:hypothetical protein
MAKHVHIPFPGGHITWSGKKVPTAKELAVFKKLIAAARKYCGCKTKTTVVLHAAGEVEETAQKCSRCGKLTYKQIEI